MKNRILKLISFAAIVAVMLMFGVSCQKEIESESDSGDGYETTLVGYIDIDTTRKCVSKKSHYAEESSVYVYDKNGRTGRTYKTIRLMSADLKVIQEWFVEYLRSNQLSDYYICSSIDPDGSKYGYFYKWRGDLYQMSSNDLMITKTQTSLRYYRVPDNMKAEGFRLPTPQDLEALYSMFTRPEDAEFELKFGMYGYDIEYDDYLRNSGMLLSKGMWLNAGLNANENTDRYGMSAWVPTSYESPRIMLYVSNNPDEYCRVRLMRTLTLDEWEEE